MMFMLATCHAAWSQEASSSLYLLSGTYANDDIQTFPVNLYKVAGGKLQKVREIVPQQSGLHSVLQWDNAIFVAYPHTIPSTMSVIHTDQPDVKDDFVFNPTRKVVIGNRQALAQSQRGIEELLFLVQGPTDKPGSCVAVTSQGKAGERVLQNAASDYSQIRFKGVPGGPSTDGSGGLVAEVHDSALQVETCGTVIPIATLSSELAQSLAKKYGGISVANDRFLVFETLYSLDEFKSHSIAKKTVSPIFVLDKQNKHWSKSSIEGSCSDSRIFGDWLASIVRYYDFTGRVNPGAQNERNITTDTQPNVREMYAMDVDKLCYYPGLLTVHNLSSNRTLTIHTDQQDSEILTIDGNLVVYRVNNGIYTATLSDQGISHPSLLVKDDKIPEIHWAFWSKQ